MAEEERMWSQRHTHETNTISYGQFGTPTYDRFSQDWHFLRNDCITGTTKEDATEQQDDRQLLRILTRPEIVIKSSRINGSDPSTRRNDTPLARFPEITAASSLIKATDHEKLIDTSTSHRSYRIAFGSALWLGADGVDSGNLVVPITAYATGLGAETLNLACIGHEHFEGAIDGDSTLRVRVPSLIGDPQSSWPGTEPILQLSFSQRSVDGHGDTFLLVRRASQTSIFEPLLHRGSDLHYSSQQSSLDPNQLVTLQASVTGGHHHVDSAFHPSDQRKLAIVDEEGNWSIWKIRGRRSRTARVLYQARLRSSGKVFSWKHRKRPASVGLFFDGWHRVIWASSNDHEVDRLIVCNRQTVKLFTLAGQELRYIDPRLDIGKASYILDIRPGPKANLCLILTSTRVLVFDIGQQEWKDTVNAKGPALLCAYQHFQNLTALSLRITDILLDNELLLALYSTESHSLSIRKLTFSEIDRKLSVMISDASSLTLPVQPKTSSVATIILASSETACSRGNMTHHQELLRVILQNEDLSIYSFWATAGVSNLSSKSASKRGLLRFPPSRSLQRKSGVRVDDADSEDDIDDFIISGSDEENDELRENNTFLQPNSLITSGRLKLMKHIDELHIAMQERHTKFVSQSTTSISETSKRLEARLHDLTLSEDIQPGCLPLSSLIENESRIGDVEAESNALQQTLSNLDQNATDWAISSCHGQSTETLMSLYNTMFDTFVDSLPSNVPDRSRVQKEREYRGVVLEQYLSGYVVRPVPEEIQAVAGKTQAGSETSQMIFSDPLQRNDVESQRFEPVSASQPLPRARFQPSKPPAVRSPLLDSLSRLQTYTRIACEFEEILTEDSDMLNHFSSVLSHVPLSCDENPVDYDYQSAVMANAAEQAETHELDLRAGGRAQQKGARLTKARKRAEELSSGLHSGKQFLRNGRIDKEPGNSTRGVNSSGQRSQDVNVGVLPIRSSGERFPGLAWRDSVAQTQHGYHLSDGHAPPESSSQAAMRENITLTQPERGIFANRADGKSHDRAKKKKKRIAGF